MPRVLPSLYALTLVAGPLSAQTPISTYADAFVMRYDRTAPAVDYTVTIRDNDRSAYFVRMQITNAPDTARVVIPDWAPGAYRLVNAGRNIADVSARDSRGNAVSVSHPDSITWAIPRGASDTILLTYSAAVREPQQWARPNNRWFLRESSGLIDGPRTFMYLDGHKLVPSHVRFTLPDGWKIGTGLIGTPDSMVYYATSYDVLIDSPILLGDFVTYHFTAGGVPHRAVVDLGGATPQYDEAAFVDMLRRISQEAINVFGSAPYKDYTYIFAGSGGGLEHLNSTTIGFNPTAMARDPHTHQGVTAHEFFHTWNVKRIRPVELGPFDYTRPVRTLNLWVSEGNTNYYEALILARSGLHTEADFVRNTENTIASHRSNPARLTISPERSSWTVWDPSSVNDGLSISYYQQGELLGFMLDLAIRDSTRNAKSYDDVMRYLFDHYSGERGFTSEDLLNAILHATGLNFHDFWRKYVSGTAEIPWNDFLRAAGWQIDIREVEVATPGIPARLENGQLVVSRDQGTLKTGDRVVKINGEEPQAMRPPAVGDRLALEIERDGRTVNTTITARAAADNRLFALTPASQGGPWRAFVVSGSAAEKAGLETGDELVEVNEQAITSRQELSNTLAGVDLNDRVTARVRRDGRARTITWKAGSYTAIRARMSDLPQVTGAMRAVRQGMLGGHGQ